MASTIKLKNGTSGAPGTLAQGEVALNRSTGIFYFGDGSAVHELHRFNNISASGHITASGNISASGTITADAITATLAAGTDNSVVVLNSSNQLVTDEIQGAVFGDDQLVTQNILAEAFTTATTDVPAGNAATATNVTAVATTDDAAFFVGVLDGASGTQAVETTSKCKVNPSTGVMATGDTTLGAGLLTTNITASGNISGSSISDITIGGDIKAYHITASGNISGSGTITGATGSFSGPLRAKQIQIISANWKDNVGYGVDEIWIPLSAQPEEKTSFNNEQSLLLMPTSGHVKEIILRTHMTTPIVTNITYKVYVRPKNKKVNGSTQSGGDITITAPTQNTTDDNNTRTTGNLGNAHPYSQYDMLGISMEWAATGTTSAGGADKIYVTVVLENDLNDLAY